MCVYVYVCMYLYLIITFIISTSIIEFFLVSLTSCSFFLMGVTIGAREHPVGSALSVRICDVVLLCDDSSSSFEVGLRRFRPAIRSEILLSNPKSYDNVILQINHM